MITQLVTSSTGEPINLEEVKIHLRLDVGETQEDDLILGLIGAARERVENITHRKLMPETHYVYYNDWPSDEDRNWDRFTPNPNPDYRYFNIPYPPLRSIPSSGLYYTNSSGSSTTLSSTKWDADTAGEPGRLVLDYNSDWPTVTLAENNPIRIEFNCGYAGSTDIPNSIKVAMKLMIGNWYENREENYVGPVGTVIEISNTVKALLSPYRIFSH